MESPPVADPGQAAISHRPVGVVVSVLAQVLVAGVPLRKESPLAVVAVAGAAAVVVAAVAPVRLLLLLLLRLLLWRRGQHLGQAPRYRG